MTGYGAHRHDSEEMAAAVEVKSLNSKYLDASLKLPPVFSDKEMEVKALLSEKMSRGKVSLSLSYQPRSAELNRVTVNRPLVRQYFEQLKETAHELGTHENDVFRMAMTLPDAYVRQENEEKIEEHWQAILGCIRAAVEACDGFRLQEGAALETKLREYLAAIEASLREVERLDPERLQNVRTRIKSHMDDYVSSDNFDANRFEQEIVYYSEKLDISEETVRLQNHLDYFRETLDKGAAGKKLNFISQEIGREINTIGSKANFAPMQRLVVNMKEELEKIKEQALNVL